MEVVRSLDKGSFDELVGWMGRGDGMQNHNAFEKFLCEELQRKAVYFGGGYMRGNSSFL